MSPSQIEHTWSVKDFDEMFYAHATGRLYGLDTDDQEMDDDAMEAMLRSNG